MNLQVMAKIVALSIEQLVKHIRYDLYIKHIFI